MHIEFAQPRRRLISLTPLVDVVFILLVFFMLASSFLDWQAVELNVTSLSQEKAAQDDSWVIMIKPGGEIELNGEQTTLDGLMSRMRDNSRDAGNKHLVVMPVSGVTVQTLIHVLDRLAAADARNVSLVR